MSSSGSLSANGLEGARYDKAGICSSARALAESSSKSTDEVYVEASNFVGLKTGERNTLNDMN